MPSAITTALLCKDSESFENGSSKIYELVYNFECPDLGEDDILINVKACALRNKIKKCLKGFKGFSGVSVGRDISGRVTKVGRNVARVKEGDDVVGIIPLDAKMSGCAKLCVLSQFDVVQKPSNVEHVDAVSVLSDAMKAYTSLYYLAKIQSGDTILLFNADSGFGSVILQLAKAVGAKVLAAVNNDRGLNLLRSRQSATMQVIDTRLKKKSLVDICLEESGGLGVDCVIDDGIEMYMNSVEGDNHDDLISFDDNDDNNLPSKHNVISSLAVGGRWITSQCDLQLDPPDSQLLFLKCASLHFLFEDFWTLSRNVQGKYLHILKDVMDKLSREVFEPFDTTVVNLDDCPKALDETISSQHAKVVVKTS